MKNLKRFLALALVLCMMCSYLPVSAFAADTATIGHEANKPADGTTTGEPFPENTAESYSFRIPALVTLSDGTLVAAADARWNTTYDGGGLDTIVSRSTDGGKNWSYTFANYLGDNGNEYNGNSTCFIDPSLAVYTTDENNDGVGEDTIYMLVDLYPSGVALNGDKETTPVYTKGFNDDGKLLLTDDGYNNSSRSYDHYLDGGKIYTSAGEEVSGYTVDAYFNVFKDGVYHSNLFFDDCDYCVVRTGFLYLTKSTDQGATWSEPELLNLKTADEQVCLVGPGRGLVTSEGVIIFPVYSYKAVNGTEYKYTSLIYSTDNGQTWARTDSIGSPTTSSEATMLELGNGNIRVFIRNELSQLVYVDYKLGTNGMTDGYWGSSVSTGVACNSDTELSAIVYSYGVEVDGVEKDVVLVSAPAGPNAAGTNNNNGAYRSSGKIFMGLIDPDDYTMTWQSSSVAVTPVATSAFDGSTYTAAQGFFAYSCLTEMYETGSVAILYEDSQQGWGAGDGYGYTMAFNTYTKSDLATAFGVTFTDNTDIEIDGDEGGDVDVVTAETVTLAVNGTYTDTIEGVALTGSYEDDIAKVEWTGTSTEGSTTYATATLGTDANYTGDTINVAECLYTFTASGSSYIIESKSSAGTYLNCTENGAAYPNSTVSTTVAVTQNGTLDNSFTLVCTTTGDGTNSSTTNDSYLFFWRNGNNYFNRNGAGTSHTVVEGESFYLYAPVTSGSGSTEIPGYEQVTSVTEGEYLIVAKYNNNYYLLHPSTSTSDAYAHVAKVTGETAASDTATAADATDYTTVTITGLSAGNTQVTVGEGTDYATTYDITVTAAGVTNAVNIELGVGDTSEVYNHSSSDTVTVNPDTTVATVATTPVASVDEAVTSITEGKYVIYSYLGVYVNNSAAAANANHIKLSTEQTVWNVAVADSEAGTYYITDSEGNYLTVGENTAGVTTTQTAVKLVYGTSTDDPGQSGFFIQDSAGTYNLNNFNENNAHAYGRSGAAGSFSRWQLKPYNIESQNVTFTGVSAGTTTATVGSTQYNITVFDAVVDVEIEVGETSQTYTHTADETVSQEPDSTIASMQVKTISSAEATIGTGTTSVDDITSGKYVIYHDCNRSDGNIYLTDNIRDTNYLALSYTEKTVWTVTVEDGAIYIQNEEGQYLTAGDSTAGLTDTKTAITLTHMDASGNDQEGLLINANGYNLNCQGCEADGSNVATAESEWKVQGKTGTGGWSRWTFAPYTEATTGSKNVTFTGVKAGSTTAVVGSTKYNITVTDPVTADLTELWARYNDVLETTEDGYTDDSWSVYHAARIAALAKLNTVGAATYATQAEADAAVAEAEELVEALEAAYAALVAAKTITINYQFGGTTVLTENYKIAATAETLTLSETIVANNVAYSISATQADGITVTDGVLTLPAVDTTVEIALDKVGTLGSGFVGGENPAVDGSCTVLDKPVTAMTVTNGISYDLNLANADKYTDTDTYTITWSTGNAKVATVDENGNVTAVGAGETTITATVKDASGNVVEVNSIPITVLEKNYDDDDATRDVALYVENIENTTVWCVVNGETSTAFEVIEGELIYGTFKSSTDQYDEDPTTTTAFSFFGDPDEAHALVYMNAVDTEDDFYLLHQDGVIQDGNDYFYDTNDNDSAAVRGAGLWQALGLMTPANQDKDGTYTYDDSRIDWTIVKNMVEWAIAKNCDGGQGLTRRTTEGDLGTNLSFVSDPMPKIEKTVDGVLPTSRLRADYRRYTEGMVAAVNELVYFKITITLPRPSVFTDTETETTGAITYTNVIVSDIILSGAYLYSLEQDEADGTTDGEISVANRAQTVDITEILTEMNTSWTEGETEKTYNLYLVYQIQESDIPKFYIDNIAELNYNYDSAYSRGTQAGAADAEAKISVVGTSIDNVVIDFGQSFVYTGLTDAQLKLVDLGEHKTTYGTALVEGVGDALTDNDGNEYYEEYKVTYTPDSILLAPDAVRLNGTYLDSGKTVSKLINGFMVYPATTVYYEEGFMMNEDSTWDTTNAAKATGKQTFELLGESQFNENGELTGKISNKKHAYGYDPLYEGEGYDYGDSYASATNIGQTTTFEFTGTGFDLYANCTTETGYVSILVKNSAGKYVKMYTVDTVVKPGETVATTGSSGNEYHLPIVSVDLVDPDTYTVTVTKIMETEPVKLDGIRIHNTLPIVDETTKIDSSLFEIDLEDNPEFYQLRDYVLSAVDVNDVASLYYGENWMDNSNDLIGALAEQVLGKISGDEEEPTDVAVVTSTGANIYTDDTTAQDLLDNGPKNELFLFPEQTLTFKVETSRMMQIGLKAPRIPVADDVKTEENEECKVTYTLSYTVNDVETVVATNEPLSTSVDMFYALGNSALETAQVYTVSITNTGSDILSITDLKICDDPNAVFVPLTVEDIEQILVNSGLGEQEPEVTYADAALTVSLVDYTGAELSAATVTANGILGEDHTFTAAEVLEAVQMPEGYALVGEAADVEVAYGDTQTVTIQIGLTATVNITYVKLTTGKTTTATITKVQTADGYCRIDASEIKALAPNGSRIFWMVPVVIPYGNTVSLYIPVI